MNYNDLTIVIPLRIDSEDRLQNLYAIIGSLKQMDGLRIIILEADSQRHWEPIEGISCVFREDDNPLFFRTKYINQLCAMVETEFMGVWDADMIVPIAQIENSMELLRLQKADMVYPFDGHCYSVDNDIRTSYLAMRSESLLLNNIGSLTCMYGRHSCGGAFLVNRKAYVEAGGENEKFYGWGPEDLERYKRWEIRGYRVLRVEGGIFHLEHQRGQNSNYFNIETRQQLLRALLETCREKGR